MARFSYLAIDRKGLERRGAIEAPGEAQAAAKLSERQWFVVRILPDAAEAAAHAAQPAGKPASRWPGTHLTLRQRALFTRQLASLAAVSPLDEALRTIARQTGSRRARTVLARVEAMMGEGMSLAEALRCEEASFPPVYRAIMAAGETSATLPAVAERLADSLDREVAVATRARRVWLRFVTQALAAALLTLGLVWSGHFPLPAEHRGTLIEAAMGLWTVARSGPLLVAGFILVGALGLVLWRLPGPRLARHALLLHLPVVGRWLRNRHAARLARMLAAVIDAQLPLVDGLRFAAASTRNRAIVRALNRIAGRVRAGGSLAAALRQDDVFPPLLVYLATSGESAGQLAPMLERAAAYLDVERESRGRLVLAALEPVMSVATAALVALIVIAVLPRG